MTTREWAFFTRDSGGGLGLVSLHRRKFLCWQFVLSWQPYRSDELRRWLAVTTQRGNQWHHSLHVLRLGRLMLSGQSCALSGKCSCAASASELNRYSRELRPLKAPPSQDDTQ